MMDVLGRYIQPGHLVAYSVQQGHRPYLKVSRVHEVYVDRVTVMTVTWDGVSKRKVSLRKSEKVVIVSDVATASIQDPVDGLFVARKGRKDAPN